MLVKEKSSSNALVEYGRYGTYNGTGNYVRKGKSNYPIALAQLEEVAFPSVFEGVGKTRYDSNNACYVVTNSTNSDLPLLSDLGYDVNPQGLVYARLEGLQYYTK